MHPHRLLFLLLIAAGVSFAQDTKFPVGPQYLVTASSTMFLCPIATPSLSLGEASPPPASVTTTEAAIAQEAPAAAAITNQTFLSDVYWGDHTTSDVESRRIVTPRLSASQTEMNTVATMAEAEIPSTTEWLPGMAAQSAGVSSGIELSSAALPANLPASIFDAGVTGVTSAEALRGRGYGIPLGQVAAYWKVHKTSVPHACSPIATSSAGKLSEYSSKNSLRRS